MIRSQSIARAESTGASAGQASTEPASGRYSLALGSVLSRGSSYIGSIRLYRPDEQQRHVTLGPVLTRPIRWELIAQQYDQMIRYATALRLGTAESEQVLRRFTRGGPKHPTYAA